MHIFQCKELNFITDVYFYTVQRMDNPLSVFYAIFEYGGFYNERIRKCI
nr:MAG TPA_asm: hypothetical protein [Caudoviricetes sp.]